jgi:hypothetical protein
METMYKLFTSSLLLGSGLIACAQTNGNLGRDLMPAGEETIDLPPDHGAEYDMSGGLAVGDPVPDFTVYDASGESATLSDLLSRDKPVLLISGSVTCDKFADSFRIGNDNALGLNTRAFLLNQQDDLAIVFLYGMEAHPTSGACPTNCPVAQTTDTLVAQHEIYADRLAALTSWTSATDLEFPFAMFADNPDNAVYNTFFERPNGVVGINCDGRVGLRADWMTSFLGVDAGQDQTTAWAASQAACYAENGSLAIDGNPQDSPAFTIAPNPSVFGSETRILSAPARWTSLEIRDALGRLHHEGLLAPDGDRSLALPLLPHGLYHVILRNDHASVSRRWIVHE